MRHLQVFAILTALASGAAGLAAAHDSASFLSERSITAVSGEKSNIPRVQVFERLDPGAALAVSGQGQRIFGRDVLIIGDTRIRFSTGGSRFLMTLMAGELTTVISGKKIEREEGEAWVIGSWQLVELITGDDSASLDVLEFVRALR